MSSLAYRGNYSRMNLTENSGETLEKRWWANASRWLGPTHVSQLKTMQLLIELHHINSDNNNNYYIYFAFVAYFHLWSPFITNLNVSTDLRRYDMSGKVFKISMDKIFKICDNINDLFVSLTSLIVVPPHTHNACFC